MRYQDIETRTIYRVNLNSNYAQYVHNKIWNDSGKVTNADLPDKNIYEEVT